MGLISKEWAELISKYSYIEKAEIQGMLLVIIYAGKDGRLRRKTLPRRATAPQLQQVLKNIRNEIGVTTYGKGMNSDIFVTA